MQSNLLVPLIAIGNMLVFQGVQQTGSLDVAVIKGEIRGLFVDGRIVVDAKFFPRISPNYDRPQVDPSSWWDLWTCSESDGGQGDIKNSEVLPRELEEDDLLVCSPTVLGFSLNKKRWRA